MMNNFITIKCSKGQSKLVPDLRTGMKIGAIGGLIGFGVPTLGIVYGHLALGLIATGIIGTVLYSMACNWTYKTLTFEKKK